MRVSLVGTRVWLVVLLGVTGSAQAADANGSGDDAYEDMGSRPNRMAIQPMHRHEQPRKVRKRARPSLIEHEDDEATAGSLK